MEYKIGDWVTVLDEIPKGISNFHRGTKTFKIGYVDRSEPSNSFVCEDSKDIGNGIFVGAFRHALPEEIPGYTAPKQENYDYLKKIFKELNIN